MEVLFQLLNANFFSKGDKIQIQKTLVYFKYFSYCTPLSKIQRFRWHQEPCDFEKVGFHIMLKSKKSIKSFSVADRS